MAVNLIDHLSAELHLKRYQAEGVAGLLLQLAELKMLTDDFMRVVDTVPAISDILAKSPCTELSTIHPARAVISRWLGGLGGLAAVVDGFHRLSLDQQSIAPFAEVLVQFLCDHAGEDVAKQLAAALR